MHILFQKAAYTDTTGLPLAFSESKKKVVQYVRQTFPQYKYHKDQDLWDNTNDNLILLIHYEEDVVNLDDPSPCFVIQMVNSPELLYWSNKMGWVGKEDRSHFSDQQKNQMNLPMDGAWIQV